MVNGVFHRQWYRWLGMRISTKILLYGLVNSTEQTIQVGTYGPSDVYYRHSHGYYMA